MSNTCRIFLKGCLMSACMSLAGALTSCDKMIFDDQGDCSVQYRLSFRYTKNILNADAFGSQVTDINVALYDSSGKMVYKKSEHRNPSIENEFYMDIEVAPGNYDIVAWCEGRSLNESAESFTLTGQNIGNNISSSGAYLTLQERNGAYYSSRDLNRLYYGFSKNVEFADSYGVIDIDPVYLTRDTNHITVQLQNMFGMPIDANMVSFEIEGRNSELNWQNLLEGDKAFTYTPWIVRPVFSDNPVYKEDGEDTEDKTRNTMADSQIPNGIQAEFTTSRLMAGVEQRLTVRLKETGEEILSIPMVEYLLLVRGYYEEAKSPQDYLDRYDDFSMLFFIDEGYNWIRSRVFINNWRVVPPQHEIL